ncbi:condensin complex subunit 3-like isoform X1 [Patiria miniata]|uniref:Nuclear condensin complex subunit 3 C-terminal domain-containing protein n=1 Tax=Patiria miniata TaxID=46514 RepID=A0A914B4M3_PATMI|nr:condensin complex subunit 3-like isoform X1 [Patiria miniata]XP_038070752.1 condensin complex subunit 3-like isoform X1 [Patiria miniata]XP_038070753.1 condensin complex subunit 3-like isoform X1 [Patiria miniata]XP_038070754.1 condensin complex subunit 3-like isoform X1 [Patiria miniata]XP_038070758.1 condensin complex subunit 3-like isoform X1 [Patiria miniata]
MPSKKGKTLSEVFEDCQKGIHNHAKLTTALRTTYDEVLNSQPKLDDKTAFHQEFLGFFKHALIIFKREPAVERTLDFVAKFAASFAIVEKSADEAEEEPAESPADNFMVFLFSFLFQHHNARDRAVRFRVCQMINKLLVNLGDEAQIDEDLFEQIYDCMLIRLHDKFPAVRTQAVTAVARLQDPTDADCPVIAAYLHLIEHDVNYEVRRAVLSNLSMSTRTLPKILDRTRDVKDSVRKTAFLVLAEKVHIKALTIAQRVQLLQDGLTDRSDTVKDACSGKLLQAWLRIFDGNVLDLLACLDVENSCKTAELALDVVLRKAQSQELVDNFDLLDETYVIPADKLTCESALYWQCLCSFLKAQGADGEMLLDRMLPNVTIFSNYIRSFLEKLKPTALNETEVEETLKQEFVAQQLLQLCGILDLSDEVGRKHLDVMIRDMLIAPHIPSSLVPRLVTHFTTLHPGDEEQVNLTAEIIADVREPISVLETSLTEGEKRKKELKLASVRVELNQARDALEDCVNMEDFSRAAELKNLVTELEASKHSLLEESSISIREVRLEKSDPGTLVKCLTIASEILQRLTSKGLSPTLQTLIDTLVLPGIQNTDPSVRNMAVKCVGLASQLSRDFAHRHLLLLMQISQVDQETIQVTALQSIFDLLHTFGLDAFKIATSAPSVGDGDSRASAEDQGDDEVEEQGVDGGTAGLQQDKSAASSVLAILTGLLDSESVDVRTVVAEGMAKLLLSGRVTSPKLLSRLLLLWYNPTTEEDLHLRHCLGTFFPVFAFAARANQDCVEEAFLPTLDTLFNAPTTSPLAQVNENNVAELLVHLTDQRNLRQETALQESSVHDSLSLKLCNKILGDMEAPGVRVLCKVLNMLHLSTSNANIVKDLSVLAEQMVEKAEEKMAKKYLEKFRQNLQECSAKLDNDATEPQSHEGDNREMGQASGDNREMGQVSGDNGEMGQASGDNGEMGQASGAEEGTETQTTEEANVNKTLDQQGQDVTSPVVDRVPPINGSPTVLTVNRTVGDGADEEAAQPPRTGGRGQRSRRKPPAVTQEE